MSRYFVKWKGVESGPYSATQLRDMFNAGKVGLIHYIREENSEQWHLFREFLAGDDISEHKDVQQAQAKKLSVYLQYFAYLLCGGAFLSIYIYLCALAFCVYLFLACDRKFSLEIFCISTVIAISGLLFFQAVVPVLMQ